MEIYILESLEASEHLTGKELYNDTLRWEQEKNKNLIVKYVEIESKNQFMAFLEEIANNSSKKTILLQLEMHGLGDKSGIILKSNETITWNELSSPLRKIEQNRGELHLLMATCYGNYVGQLLLHGNFPFTSFTGTQSKITTGQIINDYTAIYTYLFHEKSFLDAIKKMEELDIKTQLKTKYSKSLLKLLIEKTIIEFPIQDDLEILAHMLDGLFELQVRKLLNKPTEKITRLDIVNAVKIYLNKFETSESIIAKGG